MSPKCHHHVNDDLRTNRIVLTCVFLSILIFLSISCLAHWFIRKHEREMHNNDLEACQPLLAEERPDSYHTFPPSSHEAFLQDPEIRRMLRHERVCDNISGTYRISVQRLDDDEISLSSDGSDSDNEDKPDRVVGRGMEEDEELSESESESSDGSDSDSDEVVEGRQLMNMKRTGLPKRVAMLKGVRD